jgi:hypothetical protein
MYTVITLGPENFNLFIRLFSQKQSVAQSLLFEQKKIVTVEKILQSQTTPGLNRSSPVGPRLGRGLESGEVDI